MNVCTWIGCLMPYVVVVNSDFCYMIRATWHRELREQNRRPYRPEVVCVSSFQQSQIRFFQGCVRARGVQLKNSDDQISTTEWAGGPARRQFGFSKFSSMISSLLLFSYRDLDSWEISNFPAKGSIVVKHKARLWKLKIDDQTICFSVDVLKYQIAAAFCPWKFHVFKIFLFFALFLCSFSFYRRHQHDGIQISQFEVNKKNLDMWEGERWVA